MKNILIIGMALTSVNLMINKEPRAMFAIGGDEWPGLGKVSEECSEVSTIIAKLMGTGGDPNYWDGTDLRQRLIEELGDTLAACEFASYHNEIWREVLDRKNAKLHLFYQWRADR